MADVFDTTKMKDDDAYWDALAERIAVRAMSAGAGTGTLTFAASRGGWIAATLLVGVAAALVLALNIAPQRNNSASWQDALQPSDAIGRSITVADNPPSVVSLLFGAPGMERR